MKNLRGALIVIEGCDRSGKTTQCKKIVASLEKNGTKAKYMNFPDRSTAIGQIINGYLTKKEDLSDEAMHLLFSANRWELVPKMKKLLQQGTTLIVDRYSYSGVAYSAIKNGMNLDWCKWSDAGLPKPDLVLLLTLSTEAMNSRGGFGEERYEKNEIQQEVVKVFRELKDSTWKEIDADKSIEELQEELLLHVKEAVETSQTSPLKKLW
ncbi:thymidylate kinase [Homalodisca vitripennis]|uniref:thymidylate kinase n=1 Tax=Homalodisca vitripennis TaxID=197043 RepID=UPI001EEBB04B|nr:thymidylate kinase [Homalodisca vitripennis]